MSGNSPNGSGPGVYHYRVEYPQLADATGAVAGVDAAMRGTMQREVDAFVDAAHDAAAAPRPGDLTCGSRAARVTARLAALRVDCTEYQAGATQPQAFTRTFNCDLDAGRVLALQDLFSPGAGYLMILSGAAREQLPGRVAGIDERTLADGTAPVADNFRAFLLEEKALVIVFPRYGSGTPGSRPEVSVPYGVLDRYLASRARNLVG